MNTTQHLLYDGSPFARPCDGARNIGTAPVPIVPGSTAALSLRIVSAATFRPVPITDFAAGVAAWRFCVADGLDRTRPMLYATDAVSEDIAADTLDIDVSGAWTEAMRSAIAERPKAVFLAELVGYASEEDAGTATAPVLTLMFPFCAANRRDDGAETSPLRDLSMEAHNADPEAHPGLLANVVRKNAELFADLSALSAADELGAAKNLANAILQRLKSMMTMLLLALLCASCVPAIAQTALNDIPGTKTLYTAAETDARIPPHVRTAPVEIPEDAAARGVTFTDADGIDQNAAVAIGRGAVAGVSARDVADAPSNTVVRSGSVAIGAGAVAHDESQPLKQQATAIGWNAHATAINATAIGSGAIHTNETALTGGAPLASGQKAIAIGYGAKATANDAAQIGEGVNDEAATFKFRDTTIVRNGRVAVDIDEPRIVSNAVETVMDSGVAVLDQSPVSTNGYASVSLSSHNAASDADSQLIVAVNTNDAATAATIQIGTGPHVDIYKAATVDRLLAEMSNALASAIAAGSPEWASPTWDTIHVMRLPDGESSALTPYRDAMRRVSTTGGTALSAVRSVRPADPSEPVRDEPLDGSWSLLGSPDCAILSSNVLYETSRPGAATVLFSPADGSAELRATVAMGGGATNLTLAAWPAGELESGWRRARGDELADLVTNQILGDGARMVIETNFNVSTWVCTNRAGLAVTEFLGAEGIRSFATTASGKGGGLLALAPHYGISALHTTPGFTDLRFLDEGRTVLPRGWTKVDTRGDCALWRLNSAVPTNLCARLLRESVLAGKSASRLFRFPAMHLNQHGYLSPILVAPSLNADLSGASWTQVRYAGSGTHLAADWSGCHWADLLQPLSHDMHPGDSGLPVWFFLSDRAVPLYLAHQNVGANYTLLDDALLDWLDAAIRDDSGGAESVTFLRPTDL